MSRKQKARPPSTGERAKDCDTPDDTAQSGAAATTFVGRHLFGRIPAAPIIEDKILNLMTESEVKVYVVLAAHNRGKQTNPVWPSLDKIAEEACLNRRTVMRAIARLEAIGVIRTEKGGGRIAGTRKGLSNRYYLLDTVTPQVTVSDSTTSAPQVAEKPTACNCAQPHTVTNPAGTVTGDGVNTVTPQVTRRREIVREKEGRERVVAGPMDAATRAPNRRRGLVGRTDNVEVDQRRVIEAATDKQLTEVVARLIPELNRHIGDRLTASIETAGLRDTCQRPTWRPLIARGIAATITLEQNGNRGGCNHDS